MFGFALLVLGYRVRIRGACVVYMLGCVRVCSVSVCVRYTCSGCMCSVYIRVCEGLLCECMC